MNQLFSKLHAFSHQAYLLLLECLLFDFSPPSLSKLLLTTVGNVRQRFLPLFFPRLPPGERQRASRLGLPARQELQKLQVSTP